MKVLFCCTFYFLLTLHLNAGELKNPLSYHIDSTVFRSGLKTGECLFYFSFANLPPQSQNNQQINNPEYTITYSYDSQNRTAILGKNNEFEVKLKPGTYIFQLYYSSSYAEITTSKMKIESRYKTFITCYLNEADYPPVQCEKPVIYLYPTQAMLIDVSLRPKGELLFTYPEYKNGWQVHAKPNGELTMNDKTYNYLFWESNQNRNQIPFDRTNGFIVEKENVIAFLENKLSDFGLNNKEQGDFITYWGPKLIQHPRNFVHFIYNEDCNQFAELSISPKPDHVYRIYMVFAPISDAGNQNYTEQIIPKIKREGFTVIEWGGSQLNSITTNLSENL